MNATQHWTDIPGILRVAGFSVHYSRICYEPERPLWRAIAQRDGLECSGLGKDLETALVELEKEAHEHAGS